MSFNVNREARVFGYRNGQVRTVRRPVAEGITVNGEHQVSPSGVFSGHAEFVFRSARAAAMVPGSDSGGSVTG